MRRLRIKIRILSLDFRNQNTDKVNRRSIFDSVAADMNIEFRLARLDPNGNCTNGIVRVYSRMTENADNSIKTLSVWNTDAYLNVWVVKNIKGNINGGAILGYAQFPWSGASPTDGVIIRHDYVGSIGTSNTAHAGRAAIHEIWALVRFISSFSKTVVWVAI
jgi:hypothetical protein